ncbi:MAG: hypothetical protein HYT81_08545 [Gemmatimonadetes bacterium]|nr:hypothetical protein [Gemmatimonadota bacterium]MBI2404153.1 hypothetical protein [Gemmatimonadota bacterium]
MAGLILTLLTGCGWHDQAEAATLQDSQCPLSSAQQVKAVKNFEALMPAFRHPRCSNCHGGIDFLSPGYEKLHGGGEVEMVDREVRGPDGSLIARRRPDFTTCTTCHDAVSRWAPPSPMLNAHFAGRTAAQICERMKGGPPDQPPAQFEHHLAQDVLIRAAFEGRRGHKELSPQPPPMSHEEFLTKASQWAKPLTNPTSGEWLGAPSCGCVPPVGWHGTITYTQAVDWSGDDPDADEAVEHLGLLPWIDGFTGRSTVQLGFDFFGDAVGIWTGEGRLDDDDECSTYTSSISGSGKARLSVSDARTGEDWPLQYEELPASVNVEITGDGSYLIGMRTGDLVGKSLGKGKGSRAKCGDPFSEESEESHSFSYRAEGHVDPSNPNTLSGTATVRRRDWNVTVTWNLQRQ